jgi:hypothetical protein
LAGAQAGSDVGASLCLPIFQEQEIRYGTDVMHLLQRAPQRLSAWTGLLSTIASHRHPPTGSWREPQVAIAAGICQPSTMTLR